MRALGIAAALALVALGGPARAYERSTTAGGTPLAWGSPLVPYATNPSDFACGAADDPAPLLAAVRASFAAWRPTCPDGGATGLELVDAGILEEVRIGEDGTSENVVVFREGWCSERLDPAEPCLHNDDPSDCNNLFNCFEDGLGGEDRGIVALTSVLYYPDSGRIVDADVEMNGWDGEGSGEPLDPPQTLAPPRGWYFTCEDPGAGPSACATYGQTGCTYVDVQNTLTHEVGHFIGLRHVCDGGSEDDADLPPCPGGDYDEITMYPLTRPGDFQMRTLDADDVAGVCAAYPPFDGGGCGCGAGGAPGALALVALGVLALRPRRGRGRRGRG